MTNDEYIRTRLAEAVAMPDAPLSAPPPGAELRARARRTRAVRRSMVLATVLIVAAVVGATVLLRPVSRAAAPVDAPVVSPRQLTTAVNISSVRDVTASPCQRGWTPSWSGNKCYSLKPEATDGSPTDLRLLNVLGARVVTPSTTTGGSGHIVLLLQGADAKRLEKLYRSGATLAVSVSGRMIVDRLRPSRTTNLLTLEASTPTINWTWHALTVADTPAWSARDDFWNPPYTCDEKRDIPLPPNRTIPTVPPHRNYPREPNVAFTPDDPPLWWVCVPETGAGFRKRQIAKEDAWDPRTVATIRASAVTRIIVGSAPQHVFNDSKPMETPTGQQVTIEVSYAGYFAAHGNPQRNGTILDHVTALGAPAVVEPGHNPDSVKVLVTARGYDISAEGSGRYKNLAPITTDQLVAIIDSLHL